MHSDSFVWPPTIHALYAPATLQVTAVIAKVALKTVSGLDLPASEFLNGLKEGIVEEVADHAFDEDALHRVHQVLLGEAADDSDISDESKASYAALSKFMRDGEYRDFKDKMQQVDDGNGRGGLVWVSNGNVERWKNLRPMPPST